jgi:bidirectional [NiFe] hydrogenase diaphorase subunit
MVTLTIDGQIVQVERETPLIEAARKLGIHIPTLCYHQALKPYGACRVCAVEIIGSRRSRLVTSCNYPAQEGLEVRTASNRVKVARKMLMELLLARCPEVGVVRQLAERMGVKRSRLKKKEDRRCILCGLCVRVCEEMVGVCAISFANRGTERQVSTPFQIESDVCIGCGACTYICPTGCIEMVDKPGSCGCRYLNMGDLALDPCPTPYQCETCKVEEEFLGEMRRVVGSVRLQASTHRRS